MTLVFSITRQNKIVSAEARFGKTDWIWRQEFTGEQNFLVCNSVSFKMYGQEVSMFMLLMANKYFPPSSGAPLFFHPCIFPTCMLSVTLTRFAQNR